MAKSLARPRSVAYSRQDGRCIYCNLPMWHSDPVEFALTHGLRPRQVVNLQCTGEHLVARQDGGRDSTSNIAAACRFCNVHRHRRKEALAPEQYKCYVEKQMALGRWHSTSVALHFRQQRS